MKKKQLPVLLLAILLAVELLAFALFLPRPELSNETRLSHVGDTVDDEFDFLLNKGWLKPETYWGII